MREHDLGFSTRSNANRAVQPLKIIARGLEFWIYEVEGLYYIANTKTLIS